MGKMSGVELAERIRKEDRLVQIIFITGYMDYIAQGYDVEALHYLLKPVTQDKLRSVLDRAAERLEGREKELCLAASGEVVRVPLREIRYLEVWKNYVTVYGQDACTVKKPLSELERELDGRFFRTGRSQIVNLHFVRKITRTQVILKDGRQLPPLPQALRGHEPGDDPLFLTEVSMRLPKLSFWEKRIDRRIAAYQSSLLASHYAEVEICTGRCGAGGMITGTISRF